MKKQRVILVKPPMNEIRTLMREYEGVGFLTKSARFHDSRSLELVKPSHRQRQSHSRHLTLFYVWNLRNQALRSGDVAF